MGELNKNTLVDVYPGNMEKDFAEIQFIALTIPIEINSVIDSNYPNFNISSVAQFYEYLDSEYSFWKSIDDKKSLETIVYYSRLDRAKHQLNLALNYYKSGSSASAKQYLKESANILKNGVLFSKTKLARVLIDYKDKGSSFFEGFKYMYKSDKAGTVSWSPLHFEGACLALNLQGFLKDAEKLSKKLALAVKDSADLAQENFANLNKKYTEAFISQKNKILEIKKQSDDEIENLKAQSQDYFNQKEKRCADLEKLYSEKLKLEAPAQYWQKMAKSYDSKGWWWFGFGLGTAILAIAGLLLIILYMPNLFDKDLHILDMIKNSAIVTVIASIMIYIVRIFIKMALSSFHLSRDAKEREQLSFFYLALIEKNAVSEKERALILNSLFSRSDTGLLKGDSAPAMSANVGELVDIVAKVNNK